MSEKLGAGIVTAAGIAPLCALCVLSPAALGSVVAGVFGWLGGVEALLAGVLMAAVGLLVYRDLRRRRQLSRPTGEDRCGLRQGMREQNGLDVSEIAPGAQPGQQGGRS